MEPKRRFLLIAAYIGVALAWGSTFAGIKIAVEDFPPFTLAAIRFIIAGALMIGLFRLVGIPLPRKGDYSRLAIVGCLLLTGGNGLLSFAEQYVDSAFAALMSNIAPFIFVGLAAMTGRQVPRLAWAGLMIGTAGVFVLVSPQLLGGGTFEGITAGEYWMAIAALVVGPACWALGTFRNNYRPARCHALMGAGFQTLFGGLGALAVSVILGEWFGGFTVSASSMGAVVYLIIVGSFLGYISYNYCTMHLAPHMTATTGYLNIVVAVSLGVLLLGEQLSREMLVGGGVIVLGVFLVNTARLRQRFSRSGENALPQPPKEPTSAATIVKP